MSEPRITDTNSANDSKGRAFGLEGNDFAYVLVALIVAFGLFLVLNVGLRVGIGVSVMVALPVMLGPLLWVLLLRHNKPAGFAEDFFDDLMNGEGWSLVARAQPVPAEKEGHE
ncbi:MAG TPA: hypothetical protein VG897_14635 [Terriglobales bacterium]|nr:hypothetical protein [Bryobacteraceae bacterium]HVZ18354.1 hypothetical protein [Terriglobales bacterium]